MVVSHMRNVHETNVCRTFNTENINYLCKKREDANTKEGHPTTHSSKRC